MNISYKEANEMARDIDKKLELKAFSENKRKRIITIQHSDGSYFELHYACFNKISDEYLVVFTEHHGIFLYHKSDLIYVKEHFLTRVGRKPIKSRVLYHE